MIIDSHIHLPTLGTPQRWDYILAEASRNGIGIVIASHLGNWAAYPTAEVVNAANQAAAEFAEYASGRAMWLAYLNPQLAEWRDELDRCIKNGACGIKLWISLKDSEGGLANTLAVLEAAEQYKLPVLIHTYNRTDGNLMGEITMWEFAELSRSQPNCVMIAAHYGGNWRHSLGIIKECSSNAYLDICGGYPDIAMVQTLCEYEGAERILFGSDALGRSFASQLAKVIFAEIDDEAKEAILYKNAMQLYGIKHIPALLKYGHDEVAVTEALLTLTEDNFCFCGSWPFWPSPCETPAELNTLLAKNSIASAYVSDLGAIFSLNFPV